MLQEGSLWPSHQDQAGVCKEGRGETERDIQKQNKTKNGVTLHSAAFSEHLKSQNFAEMSLWNSNRLSIAP